MLLPSGVVCKEISDQVERDTKGTLGVLAIHENVKTTLCFFCIAHYFILVISIVPNFNIFVFSSFLQYLELRFNKYLRLCGTILFIIQTASKLQSCSMVLGATRIIWLSVTGCFLWAADEVTTVPGWLGAGETKLLHRNEVGRGCWATCLLGLHGHCWIPTAVTWHQHHARGRATLLYRIAVWRAVIRLPAGETHNEFKM